MPLVPLDEELIGPTNHAAAPGGEALLPWSVGNQPGISEYALLVALGDGVSGRPMKEELDDLDYWLKPE